MSSSACYCHPLGKASIPDGYGPGDQNHWHVQLLLSFDQTLRISKHRLFAKKYFESASGTCHRRSQEIARITVEVPTKKTGSQALVRFDCIHPVLAVCLHVPHLFQCEAYPDQENKFKTLHEVADLYVCPWFILIESTHTHVHCRPEQIQSASLCAVRVQAFVYLDPKNTGYITDLEKFAEAGFPESNDLQPGSTWVWCRACSTVHFNGDACNL